MTEGDVKALCALLVIFELINVATQATIGDSAMSMPLPSLVYTMHPECPPSNVTTEVASVLSPLAASALCTLSHTSSTNSTSQLHSISDLQQDEDIYVAG
jgi:hypothetical protein